jgi:hypothetical protein
MKNKPRLKSVMSKKDLKFLQTAGNYMEWVAVRNKYTEGCLLKHHLLKVKASK